MSHLERGHNNIRITFSPKLCLPVTNVGDETHYFCPRSQRGDISQRAHDVVKIVRARCDLTVTLKVFDVASSSLHFGTTTANGIVRSEKNLKKLTETLQFTVFICRLCFWLLHFLNSFLRI